MQQGVKFDAENLAEMVLFCRNLKAISNSRPGGRSEKTVETAVKFSHRINGCNFWTICPTELYLTYLEMAENFQKNSGDVTPVYHPFRRAWTLVGQRNYQFDDAPQKEENVSEYLFSYPLHLNKSQKLLRSSPPSPSLPFDSINIYATRFFLNPPQPPRKKNLFYGFNRFDRSDKFYITDYKFIQSYLLHNKCLITNTL